MNYQTLLFEPRDGIAFVTINRPDKLNALNDHVMLELADAAPRRQGCRHAADPDGRDDRCPGSVPHRARQQSGTRRRFARRVRENAAGDPRDGTARRTPGDGSRRSGARDEPRRRTAARGESLWFARRDPGHEGRDNRILGKALGQISGTLVLLLGANTACVTERDRPGPPQVSFTIDDTTVVSSRTDTVSGSVHVVDPDGIDSVWVTVGSEQQVHDGGFSRGFTATYRFITPSGQQAGTHIPMVVRARDVAAFETQKDTYVVVVP